MATFQPTRDLYVIQILYTSRALQKIWGGSRGYFEGQRTRFSCWNGYISWARQNLHATNRRASRPTIEAQQLHMSFFFIIVPFYTSILLFLFFFVSFLFYIPFLILNFIPLVGSFGCYLVYSKLVFLFFCYNHYSSFIFVISVRCDMSRSKHLEENT